MLSAVLSVYSLLDSITGQRIVQLLVGPVVDRFVSMEGRWCEMIFCVVGGTGSGVVLHCRRESAGGAAGGVHGTAVGRTTCIRHGSHVASSGEAS